MSNSNSTAKVLEAFLSSGSKPEQGYKACASLTKLGDRYGHNRLENACSKVWEFTSTPSIRIISSMLKNGQDKVRETSFDDTAISKGHGITRGAAYFAKGASCLYKNNDFQLMLKNPVHRLRCLLPCVKSSYILYPHTF